MARGVGRAAAGSKVSQINMRATKAAYRKCMHDFEEFRCFTCMVVLHPYEMGWLKRPQPEKLDCPDIAYVAWGRDPVFQDLFDAEGRRASNILRAMGTFGGMVLGDTIIDFHADDRQQIKVWRGYGVTDQFWLRLPRQQIRNSPDYAKWTKQLELGYELVELGRQRKWRRKKVLVLEDA